MLIEAPPLLENVDFNNWASRLTAFINKMQTEIYLEPLSAAPTNLKAGLLVCADNATWDPNSVAGVAPYLTFYDGSTWNAVS